MSRAKVLISILVILILIALSGASVWAAPNGEDPSDEVISGEVQDIVIEDDTVLVTLIDESGETHKVRLSLEAAIALELVLDEDGNPIVNEGAKGQIVDIDASLVIVDEEDEAAQHPVASALVEVFATELGLDYDTIMAYHEEDRMGFGVIAQACWMASKLYDPEAEENITPDDILNAKKEHDFSSITLPDGTTPKNWGQFRKAVLHGEKAKNLGAIMSGRANGEQEQEEGATATSTQDQGKDKKGKGQGEDGPPGKQDKPETPPGQDKKDKGGGGGGGGGGKGKNK